MYKAIEIAQYIVSKAIEQDAPVTNWKLQHMLYAAQQYTIQQTGSPLFADNIEIKTTGNRSYPCIPAVYYKYGHYAAMPITYSARIPILRFDVIAILEKVLAKNKELPHWAHMDEYIPR